jgi:hypothetical protein
MRIPITALHGTRLAETKALIDSGAQTQFVSPKFLELNQIRRRTLPKPVKVFNVDGTENSAGTIQEYVDLTLIIDEKPSIERFLVTNLGKEDMILGYSWLAKWEPEIRWSDGLIRFRNSPGARYLEAHIAKEQEIIEFLEIRRLTQATQMAQKAHAHEKPRGIETLPKAFHQWKDRFEKQPAERLPEHQPWDHEINLKPGWNPKPAKAYRLNPKEMDHLDEFLSENKRKGYIRPSSSPIASPFFFVDKKDSSLRPCQDYRELNENTIKDSYPLPLIDELLDGLLGQKWFTKLDLRAGYNNIRIRDGDEHKAAFITPRGLFEPLVMFFGMCNSPATMMRMMQTEYADYIAQGWLKIYIDDVLIAAPTKELLQERTKMVLRRAKEIDVFFKIEKCEFVKEKVEFCGMIVSENSVEMDPVKVSGITEWPRPTTVREVRKFLGFCNYYRRFVPGYSRLTRPLHDLTKKDHKWDWTRQCEAAFLTIKKLMAEGPSLLTPDANKPFELAVDASKFATGAVLKQQDNDGHWRPCGFISQSLTPAERNYEIWDRELLGIIRGLESWRHLLQMPAHPTIVDTDHQNLTYFRTARRLNPRQARWQGKLSTYNIQLRHIPGSKMGEPDALSRRSDHSEGVEDDELTTLLPESMFVSIIDTEMQSRIRDTPRKDPLVEEALERLKASAPGALRNSLNDWETHEGLVKYRGKLYIPDDEDLRRDLVRQMHESAAMGHPGRRKTTELMMRYYWWPGMTRFIHAFVDGCAVCQQNKPDTNPRKAPPLPLTGTESNRVFAGISMDFITDLPISDGKDSVLVVVDQGLSKGVIFIPCTKDIDTLTTARLLEQHVYKWFGLPEYIISDRGPQFASKTALELGKILGYRNKLSTAYHPQTDGQTERVNQELELYLRMYCANNQEDWTTHLAAAQFTHNHRPHSTRQLSPFEVIMGYNPPAFPTIMPETNIPVVEERLREITRIRNEAKAAHEIARQRMAQRGNQIVTRYEKGDKVWLDASNLHLKHANRKFLPKRQGPFRITEVMGERTYKLELPHQWNVHPVFHVDLLSPYIQTKEHGPSFSEPPPSVIDGNAEYEVEQIIAHKRRHGKLMYLTTWKGWSDQTWEPASSFTNAKDTLNEYKRKKKIRHLFLTNSTIFYPHCHLRLLSNVCSHRLHHLRPPVQGPGDDPHHVLRRANVFSDRRHLARRFPPPPRFLRGSPDDGRTAKQPPLSRHHGIKGEPDGHAGSRRNAGPLHQKNVRPNAPTQSGRHMGHGTHLLPCSLP